MRTYVRLICFGCSALSAVMFTRTPSLPAVGLSIGIFSAAIVRKTFFVRHVLLRSANHYRQGSRLVSTVEYHVMHINIAAIHTQWHRKTIAHATSQTANLKVHRPALRRCNTSSSAGTVGHHIRPAHILGAPRGVVNAFLHIEIILGRKP